MTLRGLEGPPLGALLEAVDFAARAHRDQRRKGPSAAPYVNHCIEVALILTQAQIFEIHTLQAAVLHDVIEDTAVRFEDLQARFGPAVAQLVREVSDDKSLPPLERKRAQVEHAPHKSQSAACIKAADKTSNLRDLVRDAPDWSAARLAEYVRWSAQVVHNLPPLPSPLMRAFDEAYSAAALRYLGDTGAPGSP